MSLTGWRMPLILYAMLGTCLVRSVVQNAIDHEQARSPRSLSLGDILEAPTAHWLVIPLYSNPKRVMNLS